MAIGAELKRIRLANQLSAKKFADLIGVNADKYNKWEQKDIASLKEPDEIAVVDFFKVPIGDLNTITKLQNTSKIVPRGTSTEIKKEVQHETGSSGDNLSDLIYNNKLLAIAHTDLASANLKLAMANTELVKKLTGSTADESEETVLSQVAKFAALLEVVAEVGSTGKVWGSKKEALEILNKRVYGRLEKKSKVGSPRIEDTADR